MTLCEESQHVSPSVVLLTKIITTILMKVIIILILFADLHIVDEEDVSRSGHLSLKSARQRDNLPVPDHHHDDDDDDDDEVQ